jgi:hypothetical protein
LINSKKGEELLAEVKEHLELYEMPVNTAIRPNLLAPLKLGRRRKQFFDDFKKHGLLFAYKKNVQLSVFGKIKKNMIRVLKLVYGLLTSKPKK